MATLNPCLNYERIASSTRSMNLNDLCAMLSSPQSRRYGVKGLKRSLMPSAYSKSAGALSTMKYSGLP